MFGAVCVGVQGQECLYHCSDEDTLLSVSGGNKYSEKLHTHSTEIYWLIDTLWKVLFRKVFLACVNGINLYMLID